MLCTHPVEMQMCIACFQDALDEERKAYAADQTKELQEENRLLRAALDLAAAHSNASHK